MKLLNILVVTALGTLLAAGCSSTTTVTSDAGDTGTSSTTDTGVKTDTGSGTTDTGGGTDSGKTPDEICKECVMTTCSAEVTACSASADTQKACQDIVTCLVACTTADCQNKCITDSMSTEAKDFVDCAYGRKTTDTKPGCQDKCTG